MDDAEEAELNEQQSHYGRSSPVPESPLLKSLGSSDQVAQADCGPKPDQIRESQFVESHHESP